MYKYLSQLVLEIFADNQEQVLKMSKISNPNNSEENYYLKIKEKKKHGVFNT